MNKLIRTFVIALALSTSLVFSAHIVTAQQPDSSGRTDIVPANIPGANQGNSLVKCGNNVSDSEGAFNSANNHRAECNFNDLINLTQNIFNLVFAFSGFIAAGLFMYAGFLMVTAMGNTNQITQAKAVFRRVTIGFLILFMSFLLIQQTLKYLDLQTQGGVNARVIIEKFIQLPGGN